MTTITRLTSAKSGLILFALLFILAIIGPGLAPHDPNAIQPDRAKQSPSWHHPLGTDFAGRDIFSRLLHSLGWAYMAGLGSTLIVALGGLPLGIWVGYRGGWLDDGLMWLIDLWITLPGLLWLLSLIALIGRDVSQVLIAISLVNMPYYARFSRTITLQEKEQRYVEAARALGASPGRVIFYHLWPNIFPRLTAQLAIYFGSAILATSALSYLGLTVQPTTPDLGNLLNEGLQVMRYSWWIVLGPLGILWLTMLAGQLIADGFID